MELFETLGITQEDLREQVVDKLVDRLVEDQLRFDGDGEGESWRSTPLARALDKRVKEHIDASVGALFEAHVVGKVEELVQGLTLQKTNEWAEPKAEPITFTQYLIQMAQQFMTEQVNYDGKSRPKDRYGGWTAHGTRITTIVEKYIHFHIEKAMKEIVEKGNTILVSGIEETVKIKLGEIAEKLTVETKIAR